jgi:hypothetical protein
MEQKNIDHIKKQITGFIDQALNAPLCERKTPEEIIIALLDVVHDESKRSGANMINIYIPHPKPEDDAVDGKII